MDFLIILIMWTCLIPGIIIRYYPFRNIISKNKKTLLFVVYTIIFILNVLALYLINKNHEISIIEYKYTHEICVLIYVAINCIIIKHNFYKHMFLYGMESLLVICIQTMVNIINKMISYNLEMRYQILISCIIYIIIFFVIGYIFIKPYLEDYGVFIVTDKTYYWSLVWIIPISMYISNLVVFLNETWGKSWQELVATLFINIASFTIYKYISLDFTERMERLERECNSQILKSQVESLKYHYNQINDIREKMSIMNHDMRHNIILLESLMNECKYEDVKKMIYKWNTDLEDGKMVSYCNNILINAILSLHIKKSESLGVKINVDINIPKRLNIEESDLAVVLSNILENAINATVKQKYDEDKIIELESKYINEKIVIRLKNRFDGNVLFGKDGLPISEEKGHGIGSRSIAAFARKYNATISNEYSNGWYTVRLLITDMEIIKEM
ncbi:sensor histidine kinase [Paraclostridium sordellii]|uniref:sensor histidine kinase n=1 Tax=Paraclostridium sordellii TaxID=1505 RepID=UPI0005E55DE8|nr:GHKL domain-containing protein [Paeniclostridium sordellii]CEO24785.1 signal transduction histidine kinase regulating citrate/malate metabolism [[Clostridium] sordellii] [Paeniclostridium sordellii]CEQ15371.1 signal transduction histidine kinase regulating citrate/malate metabolism [[Clostridium] sordellii] [Paeniclostridium sordellii]